MKEGDFNVQSAKLVSKTKLMPKIIFLTFTWVKGIHAHAVLIFDPVVLDPITSGKFITKMSLSETSFQNCSKSKKIGI